METKTFNSFSEGYETYNLYLDGSFSFEDYISLEFTPSEEEKDKYFNRDISGHIVGITTESTGDRIPADGAICLFFNTLLNLNLRTLGSTVISIIDEIFPEAEANYSYGIFANEEYVNISFEDTNTSQMILNLQVNNDKKSIVIAGFTRKPEAHQLLLDIKDTILNS